MLQGNIYLATSRSNTYLYALPGFVQDSSGEGSDAVSGLQVRTFTADTNPPTLITGGLDFSMGSLGLIFDKAIVLNTINPTGITLTFMNRTSNTMGSLTLSGAEQFGYFDLGSQIFIVLVQSEFFPLKLTSMDPYRVSITAASFTDVFGITSMAQNDVELFNVAPDFDPPMPVGFSLDMNMGILMITFQEPLSTAPGDYDLSVVYLTGTPDLDADIAYNLTNSTLTSTEFYSSRLTITISSNDLNAIKVDPAVCTTPSNCFLIANDTSFIDTEDNIAISTITPATTFIEDSTPPQLVAFSIDLNMGLLTLTFTEPLDINSIDFSQISIYGPGGSGTPVNLAGDAVNTTNYDTILLVTLERDTLNPIKSLANTGTLSLALNSAAATDTNMNNIVQISSTSAIIPTQYVPDTTPPSLIGFTPGYPEEQRITLTFDEYINPSTWNGNEFTLVLTTRQGQFVYPGFTQGSVGTTVSDQLTYTFSATEFVSPFSDQYAIAYYQGLIIFEPDEGLIADVSGNVFSGASPLVYRNNTLPPDTESPRLMSYILDLNTGSFNMTFSEAVTILTTAGQVTLQDAPTSTVNSYTLMSNGTLTSILASEFITIVMNMTDLNNIKSRSALGTSTTNTYLTANELFAMDLFGNLLENITTGLQATAVIPDTQQPIAMRFKIDINGAQVTLEFSEPMSLTIDFSQVYLGGTAQNPSPQYNLSGSSLLATEALSTRFVFSIHPDVLQTIKFDTSVCTGMENCFLFLTSISFSDISQNPVVPITTGLAPTEFTADLGSPQLLTYFLDLNSGSMRLTFSEPTNTAGFNPNGITLSPTQPGTSVMPSDAFIASATNLNTVLTLMLGSVSLNSIKVVYRSGGIQLTLASTTISDTAGNPVLAIPSETPLAPVVVLIDITSPTLRAFAPSPPSERRFSFFFDEYIDASTWDGDQLFITFSSAQGSRRYTGFNSDTVTPMFSDTINYTYTSAEFIPPLSTDYTNAYTAGSFSLTSNFNWVQDVGLNPLAAITTPVRFTNDTNRPTLDSYNLDLNVGTLALTFSEAVSIITIVNQIRIQDTATNPTRVYSLASNGTLSVSQGAAAMTITITLGTTDINSLKFDQTLATSASNTYLVALEGLANDISGNPLVGIQTGLQATNLIADTQGPMVTSTAVDLNNGMVSFRFNEPVSRTIDLSQIYVTGSAQTSPGGYSLTGSIVLSVTELATLVTITFSPAVLNMIKVDTQVCSGRSNCFLYFTASSFRDVSGNQAVPSSPAVGVSNFTEDATSPSLTAYTVDLNQGQLVLTFSEATNGMVNPFGITLFGTTPGSGSITFDFSVNTTFQLSNTILVFRLDSGRLNQLKIISNMSSGQFGLAMQSITIYDNNNIPVIPIAMSSPLAPASVIPDTTPPTLLMFIPGYPMERRMTLVFDEFVNPATWNGNQVTLTLTTIQGANNYTGFTQGTLSTATSDRIVYSFSPARFVPPFSDRYSQAYYEGTVAFLTRSGLISDIAGNAMAATSVPLVFRNTSTSFTNTPALASFELDMNMGRLLLTFSEDITVSSVSGQVQLQNTAINPSQNYTLMRDGTLSSTAISTVLSLTLDRFDLNNIKSTPFLATSEADSFLLIRNGFGRDTMNNPFNSTLNGPVQATAFIRDATPPRVDSFDLYSDDNGSMIVSFDEPINIGSIDVTLITLIGGSNSQALYTLTDGQFIDLTGSRLIFLFTLMQSDLAIIRQTTGLAEGASTTYISVGPNMCRDLVGNSILQTPSSSPIQVSTYIADTGAASLQSFTLDLNFGFLSLTFNDIIDVATVNVANLTIQNSSTSAANSYSLSSSRMLSPASSNIITISLEYVDWNGLRSNLYLATSQTNTYLSFPATFASTVGGAPLLGVPDINAQRVTTYTPDTQRLQLSFYSINFNTGLLHFEFLKPILVSSVNVSAILFQNTEVSPSAMYQLRGGEITTTAPASISLDILMSLMDILGLDGIPTLATGISDTFISFIGDFVTDTNGNALIPTTLQVSSFVADIAAPRLVYFDANLTSNSGMLILQFSEGVQFLVGSQGSFTLQNGQSNAQITLTFNNLEMITQPNRQTLVITLRNDYLNRFLTGNDIGSSGDQLYITLTSTGISDYFGNPTVAIPPTNALRVRYICELENDPSLGNC